jgi:hypothetical protein
LHSEHFKCPEDELDLEQAVAIRIHSLKEGKIVVTCHAEHKVLRQSHTYKKSLMGEADQHVKAQATAISEIQIIQEEMTDLFESIYQKEVRASAK